VRHNPFAASLLSLLVPGLGQIYAGKSFKGAAILVAAIVVGSLNLIFVLVFITANPGPGAIWAYWIPRVGHDVISFWSVIFWIWVVVDAYLEARR
jgi:TM2 domain-containing membrane protein YozV